MSRLIQLLKEKTTAIEPETDMSIINGQQYKHHTDIGNLFRLMLIVNPDHAIPQSGSQSLVPLMLPNLLEEQPNVVKKLQTAFNKIKKITATGKNPNVDLKKNYFTLLFTLLLPFTGQNNFKVTTLTNNFASKSKTSHTFQRKSIILIAKSLISNKKIELNAKDVSMIRIFLNGFEELDLANEEEAKTIGSNDIPEVTDNETTTEEEIKDSITSIINGDTLTEDVVKVKDESASKLKEISNLNNRKIEDIKTMLETNNNVDIFKVILTDNDISAQHTINTQMIAIYDKLHTEMGNDTANFVCSIFSNTFKHLNGLNGYLNALKDYITLSVDKVDGGFKTSVNIGDSTIADKHRFISNNSFKIDATGKTIVEKEKIQLPLKGQKEGLNKKMFASDLELYKAANVDKIVLEANVDVGGYAWFRYGFIPVSTDDINGIANWMNNIGPVIHASLEHDANDVSDFIIANSMTITPGIRNFASLMSDGKTDKALRIISSLMEKCGNEFKQTFNDKSKFKMLGQKIANMNFKEYKINEMVYSISYKALLSIQALDVDGLKPIPLKSNFGNIYINWNGELDMTDLSDTYAYLDIK